MYESNPWNDDFDDLPFGGDQRLIAGQRIYHVNYYILFSLKNGSIIDIYIYESNVTRIKVYFDISINWRSK